MLRPSRSQAKIRPEPRGGGWWSLPDVITLPDGFPDIPGPVDNFVYHAGARAAEGVEAIGGLAERAAGGATDVAGGIVDDVVYLANDFEFDPRGLVTTLAADLGSSGWTLPNNVAGSLIAIGTESERTYMLANGMVVHEGVEGWGASFLSKMDGAVAVTIGNDIFIRTTREEFEAGGNSFDALLIHESGHGIQSDIMGPLFYPSYLIARALANNVHDDIIFERMLPPDLVPLKPKPHDEPIEEPEAGPGVSVAPAAGVRGGGSGVSPQNGDESTGPAASVFSQLIQDDELHAAGGNSTVFDSSPTPQLVWATGDAEALDAARGNSADASSGPAVNRTPQLVSIPEVYFQSDRDALEGERVTTVGPSRSTIIVVPTSAAIAQSEQDALYAERGSIAPPRSSAPAPVFDPSVSIVDYLVASGSDHTFAARAEIASKMGMSNYVGSAAQNTLMIRLLEGRKNW